MYNIIRDDKQTKLLELGFNLYFESGSGVIIYIVIFVLS